MLITRIKPTKRGRFSLYTESGFLCAIEESTLINFRLKENAEISDEELIRIKENSTLQKAKQKAYAYLSLRAHSAVELHRKLTNTFDSDTAAYAVNEMRALDLIDDEQFALDYCAQLLRKNKSRAQIMALLASKGVDKKLAQSAVMRLDSEDNDACFNIMQKKYLQKLNAGQSEKVIAALMRRGFKYSEIKSALKRIETQLEQNISYDTYDNYDDC